MNLKEIRHCIVFGDSAAGCLKYFLSSTNCFENINIINIADDFSCGPLNKYGTGEGKENRIEWIDRLLSMTHADDEMKAYCHRRINSCVDILRNIGTSEKVLVWYANNVSDQIGLRFLSSILRNVDNLYGVNISEALIDENMPLPYTLKSLAEVSPNDIEFFLPCCAPISNSCREILRRSWQAISDDKHTLRILENGEVVFVDDVYYDSLIIEECSHQYVVCARVVGNVLSESEQLVSDLIIDWRIRVLLEKRRIAGKGFFKTMRDFYVKKM